MAERASLFPANNSGAAGPVTALDARYGLAAGYQGTGLVTARSGFRPSAAAPGLVTATTPTANKFIHVAAFQHVQQSLRGGGVYVQTNDATIDINVIDTYPPDASNSRRDLVIIHQNDIGFGDADSLMRVRYVTGTPGSGADPSLAAYPEYRTLARVTVPPGATTIASADITDLRNTAGGGIFTVASGGILPIASTGERAAIAAPYEGMTIYRTDRDWIEIYDGAAWRVQGVAVCTSTADRDSAITNPYSGQLAQITTGGDPLFQYDGGTSAWVQIAGPNLPRGIIARHLRTTNGTATTATTGATAQKYVELSAPVVSGRRYQIDIPSLSFFSPAAGNFKMQLTYTTDGSTPAVTSPILEEFQAPTNSGSVLETGSMSADYQPGTTHNLKVLASFYGATAGTYNVFASATFPFDLRVLDLGVSPASSGTNF